MLDELMDWAEFPEWCRGQRTREIVHAERPLLPMHYRLAQIADSSIDVLRLDIDGPS